MSTFYSLTSHCQSNKSTISHSTDLSLFHSSCFEFQCNVFRYNRINVSSHLGSGNFAESVQQRTLKHENKMSRSSTMICFSVNYATYRGLVDKIKESNSFKNKLLYLRTRIANERTRGLQRLQGLRHFVVTANSIKYIRNNFVDSNQQQQKKAIHADCRGKKITTFQVA